MAGYAARGWRDNEAFIDGVVPVKPGCAIAWATVPNGDAFMRPLSGAIRLLWDHGRGGAAIPRDGAPSGFWRSSNAIRQDCPNAAGRWMARVDLRRSVTPTPVIRCRYIGRGLWKPAVHQSGPASAKAIARGAGGFGWVPRCRCAGSGVRNQLDGKGRMANALPI